jgi:rRNA-processing protein FCF1
MEKKIILDTNFLLIPGHYKVDIFAELDRICLFKYKIVIYDKVIDELKKLLKAERKKDRDAAKLALALIKAKHLKTTPANSEEYVDNLIFNNADNNTIVATEDKWLRKKLQKKSIQLVYLRNQHLVLK